MVQELTKASIEMLPVPDTGTRSHAAGDSLYLEIDSRGNRRWILRTSVYGRRTRRGLGSYPAVSLTDAKRAAARVKRDLQRGRLEVRTRLEIRRDVPTFAQAAERTIAKLRPDWKSAKHAAQWSSTLDRYAMPDPEKRPNSLRDRLVDEITPLNVADVLEPIWRTRRETASRLRQRIEAVMEWAVAAGYITQNPASRKTINTLLGKPKAKVNHFKALHYSKVPAALHKVRLSTAYPLTKLAFEFMVLTAARSGEVREAIWGEIDFESATWTVPAERMKAAKEHRIPLSGMALAILRDAWELTGGEGLVFPAPKGGVMSDMTLLGVCRRLELDCVVHGFRSSFADWTEEQAHGREVLRELALAHVNDDKTKAAYVRTDLFEQRRGLMQAWADFCSS